jgi:hypothetical protein
VAETIGKAESEKGNKADALTRVNPMLAGFITFVLLLVAVLAVPIATSFRVSSRDAMNNRIDLQWAFGLVRVRLPFSHSKASSVSAQGTSKTFKRIAYSSRDKTQHFSLLQQKAFRQRIFKFVRDCWSAIYKRDINLRMQIGLGDPADTGQLWALLGPTAGLLSTIQWARIDIQPDFFDTTLEFDGSGYVRIVTLQIITLMFGLFLSPTIWRAIKLMPAKGR